MSLIGPAGGPPLKCTCSTPLSSTYISHLPTTTYGAMCVCLRTCIVFHDIKKTTRTPEQSQVQRLSTEKAGRDSSMSHRGRQRGARPWQGRVFHSVLHTDRLAMAITALPPLPSGALLNVHAPGMKIGLGGRLWPSAATMCRWLCTQDLSGRHVLELGCGCGGVGLYAAALGAASSLLTDNGEDELLQTASGNIGRNHRLLTTSAVEVKYHCWGERDLILPPRLDFVLGSDVTYSLASHDPLCRSIRWVIDERSPRVILAHEHRGLTRQGNFTPLAGAEGDEGDVALAHLDESAAALGLQVRILCTEGQDEAGIVTQKDAGAAVEPFLDLRRWLDLSAKLDRISWSEGTSLEPRATGTSLEPGAKGTSLESGSTGIPQLEWTDLLLDRGKAVSLLEVSRM